MKRNEVLIAAREKTGKTQKQVAVKIGIAESAYQRYEHGRTIPSVVMGNIIAKVLNSTSEHLWGYGTAKEL